MLEVLTLYLALVHEVLYQSFSVKPTDSPSLVQDLIGEIIKLFCHITLLLSFSCQHKLEGFRLISLKF